MSSTLRTRFRSWLSITVVLASTCVATAAWSHSDGMTGASGKPGTSTCNSCHNGGPSPTVTLTGPTELDAGVLAIYTFRIQTTQKATGLNAAVSDGTLEVAADGGGGTRLEENEITHTGPTTVVDGGVTYTFAMKTPAYGGKMTIYAAGNAVDLSDDADGDQASKTSLEITVNGPPKPPEPDASTVTPVPTTTTTTPKPIPPVPDASPVTSQDAGKAASNADAPAEESGCSIGWADRSTVPGGAIFAAMVALTAVARSRRRRR